MAFLVRSPRALTSLSQVWTHRYGRQDEAQNRSQTRGSSTAIQSELWSSWTRTTMTPSCGQGTLWPLLHRPSFRPSRLLLVGLFLVAFAAISGLFVLRGGQARIVVDLSIARPPEVVSAESSHWIRAVLTYTRARRWDWPYVRPSNGNFLQADSHVDQSRIELVFDPKKNVLTDAMARHRAMQARMVVGIEPLRALIAPCHFGDTCNGVRRPPLRTGRVVPRSPGVWTSFLRGPQKAPASGAILRAESP